MPGSTVRVKEETRGLLRELAREHHEPMQEVLAKAVEQYWRQWILEETNAAYARLRGDARGWAEIEEERALFDNTLPDGLEDE